MRIPLLIAGLIFNFCYTPHLQAQDCECTNCPQFMQDLFVGDFNINIQGATNNMLGQNGQGVCGVIVHWDHTAICDISITLTAPSGQSITLVGPIGQFCTNMGNTGTDWNVTFVPCGGSAIPDPGFAAQWNNNQNWGANNNYSGSYYPFNGCLENLTGPVNGNWVLTVTDGQAQDVGNLYDYEIIFCDPSGINCQSCEPEAGVLSQPDIEACAGDGALVLDLPPNYPPPSIEPAAPEYAYTYVISGAGGVIQTITTTPDLSAALPGTYTVCGLSYLSAHQNLLPNPNGALTMQQLANQLSSNTPPFCGDLSDNCVNVTVFPVPLDEETTEEICAPACFQFLGQFYCQSGDYVIDQMDVNGCHYNAILHLTVKLPTFNTITEIVCPNTCSSHPLFPDACSPGQYQVTLENEAGCDSILTLNFNFMNINAVVQPPAPITCTQNTVPLSGIGSTLGLGTTYLWTASNGGVISGPNNLINATAAAAGNYQLLVCRTIGGISCCDSAMATVISNIILPDTPAVNGIDTLCLGAMASYTVLSVPNASSYTWTTPAGVSILSGQGDTSIVVQWGSATSGNICVSANNACGSSPADCFFVTVLDVPTSPVLHGQVIVCKDSIYTYYIDDISGATALWQISGGTILGGNGTDTIQVAWSGTSGIACVNAVNSCGQSLQVCLNIAVESVPAQPVITGDATLCVGTNGSYSIPALIGATGYVWTVPAGASIISGQNTTNIVVNWQNAPGGNVCVRGLNNCGDGPQHCFPVNVLLQPSANAGADAAVCSLTHTLNATSSVTGSTGSWTLISGPGTAIFANDIAESTAVTVDVVGPYQFQWTESNGICVDLDTVQVVFNAVPSGITAAPICDGTNQNYSISININGGTAPFTVPGGTVVGNLFTSAPIPNGQSYVFVITDANGCSSSAISGVFNCNCATNAGQMSLQTLSACEGASITVQPAQGSNLDADDVGAFILHSNAGSTLGTVFAQNQSGTFSLGNGMVYGTTYYVSYVVANNLNGAPDLSDPCLSVAPGQPVVFYENPVADAGQDLSSCVLSLTVTGNLAPGVTSAWTVSSTPPGGIATVISPQNNSSVVNASLSGTYQLTYTLSSNGCTGSDDVLLQFGNPPVAGAVDHICDGTNQFYTVDFDISGGQAPFTVNGQAVSGATFNSNPLATGSAYNFVITDANGCTSAAITGSFNCSCSTNAGQVSLVPITACQSDSIQALLLGGQNLDADDISAFVLHTGSGASLGTVLHQNYSGKFGYWATMDFGTTYYISAIAGNNLNGFPDPNDPCFSISVGQPIIFIQDPVPNAGDDFVVCGLTANMAGVPSTFSGAWTQISGPSNATIQNLQDPLSPFSVAQSGTYVFRWTETNGMCSTVDEVEVVFWDNPVVNGLAEVCNSTNTGYSISFSVNAAAPPFMVSGLGGSFSGNTFTSIEIPNGGTYTFSLQDALGCQSVPVTGDFMCPCGTNAGTMSLVPAVFCADQQAAATWNNDALLDANDMIQFVLHDQLGSILGTVYGVNVQPVFDFGPGLSTGTTYYISAVAGNNVGGNVDLNDVCLHVTPGTPVQWKALPSVALSGDATICNGSSTVLNFNGSGSFPLQLTYDDGAGASVQLAIPNQQTVPISVTPTTTTTYTLQSVLDGSLPTCSATLSESVTVTVNQPVQAGVATAPATLCAGTAQTVQLNTLVTGEDNGGLWSETSVLPSTAGAFNPILGSFNTSGQNAGTYTFQYLLTGALPCPTESVTASVVINPTPMADAGAAQFIDCHQDMATLGGAGTSTGTGIHHSWMLGGNEVANTPQYATDQGGDYILVVDNAFGCSATDMVTVTVDNDIPVANVITVGDVRCNGENNGFIHLDSIVSAHPPVQFSVNGSPYSGNHDFEDLAPGTYAITLLDANGCDWQTGDITILEPGLLSVELASEIVAVLGDSVRLDADVSPSIQDLETITWNPLFDTLHAGNLFQNFLIFQSRYVTLTVVDSNGCRAEARVLVRIERPEQVYIPNVIKSGSADNNDRVTVFGGPGVANIKSFRIFDRWGEQVYENLNFEPNSTDIFWDGTYRGEAVMPGVYVYVAIIQFVDGEEVVYKGDVTVIR